MWMGMDVQHVNEQKARNSAKTKFNYFSGPDPLTPAQRHWEAIKAGLWLPDVFFGNGCFRNDGHGKFTEVSDAAGLETFWPWGAATGDFTNSGRQDVFITAGMGFPFWYWPNSLMMNQGNGKFVDQADTLGIEPPPRGQFSDVRINDEKVARASRCAATGDFDHSGRLSIVVNNFNDQPYYYKNQGPAKNWIAFRLQGLKHQGKQCNRDAIGAIVRLYRGNTIMTRPVLSAGGYLAQSSKTLHFGLGDSTEFDKIEIAWPGHAQPQVLNPKDVTVNTINEIPEP